MDEVWRQLSSPVFWVCTVAAGIACSIFLHFFLRALDRWLGTWNNSRKQRQDAKNQELQTNFGLFVQHDDFRPLFIAWANRQLFNALYSISLGGLTLLLSGIALSKKNNSSEYTLLNGWAPFFLTLFAIISFAYGLRKLGRALANLRVIEMAYIFERQRLINLENEKK